MTTAKGQMKSRALLSSLIFSIVLMIFPVASGVIVTINNMDVPQSYWVQGAFMLVSVAVPISALLVKRMNLRKIGFVGAEKNSIEKVFFFIPLIAAKIGFLLSGINHTMQTIIALAFFTTAIGLSEEIYFRGMIFRRLMACFPIRRTVILSSALFAAVHASQAFSGAGVITVMLAIVNAFIFGIVAAEIVILTGSLVPAIIWHALYDFINWVTSVQGAIEIILVVVQSIIMISYAIYLWTKLPNKHG